MSPPTPPSTLPSVAAQVAELAAKIAALTAQVAELAVRISDLDRSDVASGWAKWRDNQTEPGS